MVLETEGSRKYVKEATQTIKKIQEKTQGQLQVVLLKMAASYTFRWLLEYELR